MVGNSDEQRPSLQCCSASSPWSSPGSFEYILTCLMLKPKGIAYSIQHGHLVNVPLRPMSEGTLSAEMQEDMDEMT